MLTQALCHRACVHTKLYTRGCALGCAHRTVHTGLCTQGYAHIIAVRVTSFSRACGARVEQAQIFKKVKGQLRKESVEIERQICYVS